MQFFGKPKAFLLKSVVLILIANRFEELERRTHAGCKDDVKSARDWPQASASVVSGLPLPPTAPADARDLPLAELQHLYGPSFLPSVGGLGAMPPLLPQAWYQSPDVAAEMLQRERESLEQLGELTCMQSADEPDQTSFFFLVAVTFHNCSSCS